MSRFPDSHLTAALEDILATPTRLRVAKLLVGLPDKEFTGRETARLLGLSPSTALDALEVLVSRGLVRSHVVGRAHVFQANRDSYLFGMVDNLVKGEDRLRGEVAERVRSALGGEAISITLFGSYPRGTSRAASDLDLLVVTKDPETIQGRVDALETLFLRRYGLHVDAKILTPREIRAKASVPYVQEARREGVRLAGKPLDTVIRRGA